MNNVLINKKKKENNSHTFCKSYNTFYHAIFFLFNLANLVEYVWSQSMDNKSSLRYSEESEKNRD